MSNAKVKKGRVEVVAVPNEPPKPPEAATMESEEARAERERLSSEKLPEQPYLEIPPSDEALKELCPEGKDFKEFKAWYKSLDKLTVLKDAIELQKQNIELTGETQRLESEIKELRAEVERLRTRVEDREKMITRIVADKDAVIDKLEAALKRSPKADANIRQTAEALAAELLVEIVALPPNLDVKVFPLTYKGEKIKMEKDEDGFYHFWVPRKLAESLLGSASGMRYALVGPDDKMTVKRFESSRAVDITVYKHVKAQYPTGGIFWQPVIEEESGNGDA
jgi:hypothetical protein